MADVYILRVTTDIKVLNEPAAMLWVVEANSPDQAMKAVESEVSTNWAVELTTYALTPETVSKLSLSSGKARRLA